MPPRCVCSESEQAECLRYAIRPIIAQGSAGSLVVGNRYHYDATTEAIHRQGSL
jgi:hypothetical protein